MKRTACIAAALLWGSMSHGQSLPPPTLLTNQLWYITQTACGDYPLSGGYYYVTNISTNGQPWGSLQSTYPNGVTMTNPSCSSACVTNLIWYEWGKSHGTNLVIFTNITVCPAADYIFMPANPTPPYTGPTNYANWMEVTALSTNTDPSQNLYVNDDLTKPWFQWYYTYGPLSKWHFINSSYPWQPPGFQSTLNQFWKSYSPTTGTNGAIHVTLWQEYILPGGAPQFRTNYDNLYPINKWTN